MSVVARFPRSRNIYWFDRTLKSCKPYIAFVWIAEEQMIDNSAILQNQVVKVSPGGSFSAREVLIPCKQSVSEGESENLSFLLTTTS